MLMVHSSVRKVDSISTDRRLILLDSGDPVRVSALRARWTSPAADPRRGAARSDGAARPEDRPKTANPRRANAMRPPLGGAVERRVVG